MANKKTILKWVFTTVWCCIGAVIIVLLVAAVRKEDSQKCKGLNVTIEGVNNNFFVDKNDILHALNEYIDGSPVGKPVRIFNLGEMENDLQRNIWVKKAQLFFDNNTKLQVTVIEREPVARVFTTGGTTFYIDSSLTMLPLSEKFSALLPVFTGFPSDKMVLTHSDSALLRQVYQVSMAIQKDSFRMAMIDQVDITPQRTFEMMPKIGNTMIAFGDGKDAEEKFNKLELFYKEVIAKAGWSRYSVVDVRYKGQVVAKRKDRAEIVSDSVRTLQLMQTIAFNAEQMAGSDSLQVMQPDNERNSTDVNIIEQSIQRDDVPDSSESMGILKPHGLPPAGKILTNPVPMKNSGTIPAKKAVPVKAASASVAKKPQVIKPSATIKPAVTKPINKPASKKPKAVMPPKNDY